MADIRIKVAKDKAKLVKALRQAMDRPGRFRRMLMAWLCTHKAPFVY